MLGWLGSARPAHAIHFRYGNLTWRQTGTTSVQFTLTAGFERSLFTGTAPDGSLAVGDSFQDNIGFAELQTGDGRSITSLRFVAVAIDPLKDQVIGRALDPVSRRPGIDHTYRAASNGGAPWHAFYDGCCRITTLNNNNGGLYQFDAFIDMRFNAASAVASVPPVVTGPQAGFSFLIPASDPENNILRYRLADPALNEGDGLGFFQQPPGVTVDPVTGVYTVPAGLTTGLWCTQVIIEEYTQNNVKLGQTAVDFNFEVLATATGNAPRFQYPPSPPNGTTITVLVGQPIQFRVTATDADTGDLLRLNNTGIPFGATQTPRMFFDAQGGIVSTVFNWTPTINDVGAYSITYTVDDYTPAGGPGQNPTPNGNFAQTSVNIRVLQPMNITEPNGGEVYLVGDQIAIAWQSPGFRRTRGIKIELSSDGGQTFPTVITPNTPDTGLFIWSQSLPPGKLYRVRITSVADPGDFDVSDGNFSIVTGLNARQCASQSSTPLPQDIPDFTPTFTKVPINFTTNLVVGAVRVFVDISHPFIGDLEVELEAPDGTTVLLHDESGKDTDNIRTTYGHGVGFTAPAQALGVMSASWPRGRGSSTSAT